MASIQKLLIRGIRSFNPNEEQVIDFQSPLTLIVGHNGAGKTSIIECLKYITTGDLPPNSKSGAFIFDPKLANENEVKAQVRMKFTNVNGSELVCTRSLQLTQLNTKVTMKTLESLLLITLGDTQYSISSRCQDIDKEVPNHLGVSKAILENVVFCHQEDSLWPLAEPLVLKKKFDEIFAATRYTKALENIKSIRKQLQVQLKADSAVLVKEKENKERAKKLRIELAKTRQEADRLHARLQVLDGGEIESLHTAMTQLVDKKREITNIQNRMDQSVLEKDMITKSIQDLTNTITILSQNDAELQAASQQLQQFMIDQVGQKQRLENEKRHVQQEMQGCQHELSEQFAKKGQYQAEEQAHEKRKMECQLFAVELIQRHKMVGFNVSQFMESDLSRLVEKLKEERQSKDAELKSVRMELKEKENVLMEELAGLKGRIARNEESKRYRLSQIQNLKAKITESNKRLGDLSTARHKLEDVRETVAFEQVELTEFHQKVQSSEKSSLKQQMDRRIQELDQKQQELRSEASMLNFQGDTRAKLSVKRTEKQKKQDQYNRLVTNIQAECTSIIKGGFRIETLENDLAQILSQKESLLKQIQDTHLAKSNRVSALDSRLALVNQSLNQKTVELNQKLGSIKKVCGETDYLKALEKAEQELKLYRTNVSSMRSASSMYQKFIGKFKDTKCCPLCVRNFESMQQEAAFLTKLETVLARVPMATQAAESEYQKAEENVKRLRDLQSLWDDCDRLANNEIPKLSDQKNQYESERVEIAENAEDAETEKVAIQVEMDQVRSIQQRAGDSIRLHRDIEQLEREISSLNSDLSASGTSRTLEDNQVEADNVDKELKTTRSKRELIMKEQQSMQTSLQTRQARINELKNEMREAEFKVKEFEKLQTQIQEQQNEIVKLNQMQVDADNEVADVPGLLQTVEQKLHIHRQEVTVREDTLLKELQSLSDSCNRLLSVYNQIQRYVESGMGQRLTGCVGLIEAKERQMIKLRNDLEGVSSSLEGLSKKESEIQLKQRNISDNIQLRKYKADVVELEGRITMLQRKVELSRSTSIDEEYNRLKQKQDQLLGERSQIVGEIKQLEEQVRKLQLQLTTDYRDIDKKYLDLKYKVTSTELGCEDLEKYSVSLDRAIMKFHAMKMNEINKIIRELWIKTYRGTDIDTIEIRSDPDGGDSTKKNYNYRVVMVRRDVEMDMRGRCSAGQKVLASIIIRLALAETFCLNCGILALDEPTTNLDSENISSLARSLSDIIEARSNQRNFQLIIITHDEEFLGELGGSDHADFYYRVTKDRDGCSTITRMAMTGEEMYQFDE